MLNVKNKLNACLLVAYSLLYKSTLSLFKIINQIPIIANAMIEFSVS